MKYAATTRMATPIAAPIPMPAFAPALSPVFTGGGIGGGVAVILGAEMEVSNVDDMEVGMGSVVIEVLIDVTEARVMVGVGLEVEVLDVDEEDFRVGVDRVEVELRVGVDMDERPIRMISKIFHVLHVISKHTGRHLENRGLFRVQD